MLCRLTRLGVGRRRATALALALALAPTAAPATQAPLGPALALFQIGSASDVVLLDVTSRMDGGREVFDFAASFETVNGTGIALSGTLDPDPYIRWTADLFNFTNGALDLYVEIQLPVQGGPYDLLTATLTGGLTDLDGDGVFVLPLESEALLDLQPVTEIAGGVTCEGLPTGGLTIHDCGSFGPVLLPVERRVYSELGANLSFTLSPGDFASFSGEVTLVPEPRCALLLGLGCAALLALGRAREARAARASGAGPRSG